MGFIATPNFDTPILSARQVNALSSWQNFLHAQGKLTRFPQPVWSNTASSNTNAYVEVCRGYVIHRHETDYTEYLYYDINILKDNSGGNPVYVRLFYKNITPETPANALVTLTQSAFGSTRTRGRVALANFPTAGTHPADGDPVEVAVYAYRSSDASPIACTGTVYWLDEEVDPDNYTALNDATALVDAETSDVPTDLDLLAGNCEVLDVLSQGYVPGFRSVERDGAGTEFSSATMATWRWNTNMNGTMHYRVGLWKWQGKTSAEIRIKFYINTSYLLKTVTLRAGDRYTEEGSFELTGFAPVPSQQIGIRIHAVIEATEDAAGGGIVYYLYEDGEEIGSYSDFGQAVHTEGVNGNSGSDQLRDLWDNQKIIAGDAGTGYGSDGYDVAGGFPVGHAVLASRTPFMHRAICDHLPNRRGLHSIVHIEGKAYQVIYLRRLLEKDYVYYRAIGAELVYVAADGQETAQGLEDFTEDDPVQVLALADMPDMIHGRMFYIRAEMEIEENLLDFATLGYL